ncbi:hypothetical protein A2994_02425 [candidate division Kazan bacterium RIFCSPLOWO2_01_FULL_48_13]|uniref:Polymerase nucleotidyl transferase domain-containing protein n=1 Tax=candidate division Kazan bacterium RIFCSPLOWO2_01_FULL_48_13 TaxID=1798539 RepID=A0A1F4PPC1_UNCK3|nr:MAG: hypothetical protein A2994_02425 [candidate division Kazan bacterium RIFCSPLOWO2_01_FULL_48_13]
MDEIKKSVLVPIIFFSHFQFPLKLKELRRYLWQNELSEEELKKVIRLLPQINYEQDLIWYGSQIGDRLSRTKLADGFWQRTKRYRWLFANVPFLREAFVTNTLSYDNVKPGSDIDLLIVGRSGRLWTCRAILLLIFNLLRIRVRGVNKHGRFSPELWLGDSELDLKPIALDNDYYLSFWLADVTQIWPGGAPKGLWQANSWLKQALPIAWRSPRSKEWPIGHSSLGCRLIESVLSGRWGDRLEQKLKSVQQRIIKRNLPRLSVNPSVLVEDNIIKLHFNDRRAQVRDAIEGALSELLAED